jgi:predicted acetyltransferase
MYRNLGIGKQAVKYIMQQNPGYWEMRVIDENKRAVYFWNKVLKEATNDNYKVYNKNDNEWLGKVFVGKIN